MEEQRAHRNLDVWKKSLEFAKDIYEVTKKYPQSEIYGLISQIKRAVVSIPSNIAEGAARKGKKEFLQFINVAQGSISELDTQLELSLMLEYISKDQYDKLMHDLKTISKMLFGLSRSLVNSKK